MEMDSDEDLLRRLAAGGSVDYAAWPRLLCTVVSRIETIAHNDFPIPILPPPKPHSLMQPPVLPSSVLPTANAGGPAAAAGRGVSAPGPDSNPPSQDDMNKENTNPVRSATPQADTSTDAAAAGTSTTSSNSTATATGVPVPGPAGALAGASSPHSSSDIDVDSVLPPQIADLLNLIITTLTTTFAQYPPHTVQRLCELVLSPRQHYRSLAAYLHAVDRVISVSSGSNVYPLPPAIPDMSAMSMLANGVSSGATNGDASGNGTHASPNVGSDEALGGALLTPIPWLRRRPASAGDDNNTEEGSSPPSSSDSGDVLVTSATSSVNGVVAGSEFRSSGGSSAPATASSAAEGQPQAESEDDQVEPSDEPVQQPSETPPQAGSQEAPGGSSQHMEPRIRTESTETIDGPNGIGSIETVSVTVNGIPSHGAMAAAVQLQQQRGITQGELLRQEQKAGVVPVSQLARAQAAVQAVSAGNGSHGGNHDQGSDNQDTEETDPSSERHKEAPADGTDAAMTGMDTSPSKEKSADESQKEEGQSAEGAQEKAEKNAGEEDDEDEIPHARGPEEIGAADTGPQPAATALAGGAEGSSFVISSSSDGNVVAVHGMNVEAAVGRKSVPVETTGATAAVAPSDGAKKTVVGAQDEEMKDVDGSSPSSTEESPATLRASTPKREAEEEAPTALPAKKRKDEHDEDEDTTADQPGAEARKDDNTEDKKSDEADADETPTESVKSEETVSAR